MDTRLINFDTLLWLRDNIEEELFTMYKNDVKYIELYTLYDQMIAQTKLETISL